MARHSFLLQIASTVERGKLVKVQLISQRREGSESLGRPVVYEMLPAAADDDRGNWVLFDIDGETELAVFQETHYGLLSSLAYNTARGCELKLAQLRNGGTP